MLLIKRIPVLIMLLISGQGFSQNVQLGSYNVLWDTPSKNSGGSMPCGGGDIGLNVWVEKGELLFYMSRSGAFDENNQFPKLGRVRLKLDPNPFLNAEKFSQELKLEQGCVVVKGKKDGIEVKINIWVDVLKPLIHLDIDANLPVNATVAYETWRTADRVMSLREGLSTSYKTMPGKKVISYRDEVAFSGDQVLFYHRNKPGATVFDFAVHQQKLDSIKGNLLNPLKNLTYGGMMYGNTMIAAGTNTGTYAGTVYKGFRIRSSSAAKKHAIVVALHIDRTKTLGKWQNDLKIQLHNSKKHVQKAKAETEKWWGKFWQRSHIFVEASAKDSISEVWQMGRNYQLFRYMLGCNAFGEWPTKFNGGLFTYDPVYVDEKYPFSPDFRLWGGGTFTAQNQRLVYWPMLKSGDFEIMLPQFEFYKKILANAEKRTRYYWGVEGANFTEQIENFGLPQPFEYNANEYIHTTKRPADFDRSLQYNDWLTFGWDTVFEFDLMILDLQLFDERDISAYLPLIKSSLRFFDAYYQDRQLRRSTKALDENGHLVLYPGSAAETYKTTYNSVTTIAALQTVTQRLLQLPKNYLTSEEIAYFKGFLKRVPPIHFREINGYKTIAPAVAWDRINNEETPQLYPVFPYGIYHLGKKEGLKWALNTFNQDTTAIKHRGYVGWKQDNIFVARLGLTKEALHLTRQKLKNAPRRFPAFWGPGFDWVPDHNWGGSGMIGLQEMLMQTYGDKIYLFPAWPKDSDVDFKLWAPYRTTVEAKLKNGRLTYLKVTPQSRKKDVVLMLDVK